MKSHFCRHFFSLMLGAGFLSLTGGCSEDHVMTSNDTATFSLALTVDNTFRHPDGSVASGVDAPQPELAEVSVAMHSLAGEYSHVWPSFSDFPENDTYFSGQYYLEAFSDQAAEGFVRPSYGAALDVTLMPRTHVDGQMTLRPVSTANRVTFSQEFSSYFSDVRAWLHAEGGGYFDCASAGERCLYLMPGPTSLYLELTLPDGRKTGYRAATVENAASATLYDYSVTADLSGEAPVVECVVASEKFSVTLTDGFISAAPPVITPRGWTPGSSYILPEGENPPSPVTADIVAQAPLGHLYLTVNSAYLNANGFPAQCDLLDLSEEDRQTLTSFGLRWEGEGTEGSVDFTGLLGNLVFLNEAQSHTVIGLMAEDNQGRVGEPVMADITTTPMEITVTSVSPAMTGVREAEITVHATATNFSDNIEIELLNPKGEWVSTEVISCSEEQTDLHRIRFTIPEGTGDINARILYCKEVRKDFVIGRFMPAFSLLVDPFATYCCVRVVAEDPEVVRAVTSGLYVYLNNQRASVLMREPDTGLIIITSLTPHTGYVMSSTMMDSPDKDDFTPEIKFTTESTPGLPNADFEERNDGISYADLPCGGRYSQTSVAIFNWQNHRSFSLEEPKDWANTNSKTFNRRSANHNTWYMQPSAYIVRDDSYDGTFAMCLRSVAFDVNGEIIPDYLQTGQPYLKYSPIVPNISSRAAGKLFLGSYSFNPSTMEETYNDIVDWQARPMSLNGYYKYSPSRNNPSDVGLAIIEVYGEVDGERKVIGSSVAHLPVANSYTAFRAALSYSYFGVKATGLKVMFASSSSIGTIAEESASIVTTPYPEDGASVGSTLWLDHVNLSY